MIIIDPDRDGVNIFRDDKASRIQGNIEDVCVQILHRICYATDNAGNPRQLLNVGVVRNGDGIYYIDKLRSFGLTVKEIHSQHINIVMPTIEK